LRTREDPRLSICINTKDRAPFLVETVDSILRQIVRGVEVVVVDGGSTDRTPEVMAEYQEAHSVVTFVRSERSVGIDEGYDLAVAHASGEFCWLLPDDDLVVPGALQDLIARLDESVDLLILNLECRTRDMAIDLDQRLFAREEDRLFSRSELGVALSEFGFGLSYIGVVVVRRNLWFEHDRGRFFGTYFVHMGVIMGSARIRKVSYVAKPLIWYRSGNSSWTPLSFEIWHKKWPDLIWSFDAFPEHVRASITERMPWRRTLTLVKARAMGEFDYKMYSEHIREVEGLWRRLTPLIIAMIPSIALSYLLLFWCASFRRTGRYPLYNLMVSSPNPELASRLLTALGVGFGPEAESVAAPDVEGWAPRSGGGQR
jgi:abequosyltransferase